jgi:hypothetical protein
VRGLHAQIIVMLSGTTLMFVGIILVMRPNIFGACGSRQCCATCVATPIPIARNKGATLQHDFLGLSLWSSVRFSKRSSTSGHVPGKIRRNQTQTLPRLSKRRDAVRVLDKVPATAELTRDHGSERPPLVLPWPRVMAMDTETITDMETIMEAIGVHRLSVLRWPETMATGMAIMDIQAILAPPRPPLKTLDSLKIQLG